MISIVKKSYFTLLELLIVLFLLSFGLILTGVKIKSLYKEQRFLSETQRVLSHLAMAQDLMLIMDTDVQVKFDKDRESEQLECWIEIEKPLEKAWARLIERKLELSAIQSCQFSGHQESPLVLQFALGGMSKGTLILSDAKEKDIHLDKNRTYAIELLGYPSPLGSKTTSSQDQVGIESTMLSSKDQTGKSQSLYPSEVYKKLYDDPSQTN